jgi:hypothetical protein
MRPSYIVYEAVNVALREVVIGVDVEADLETLLERHRRLPPVCVARWRPPQSVAYKIVEKGLDDADAAALAGHYAKAAIWQGFRVFVDRFSRA